VVEVEKMVDLTLIITYSFMIIIFVFVMMLFIGYVNILTKGKMEKNGQRRK